MNKTNIALATDAPRFPSPIYQITVCFVNSSHVVHVLMTLPIQFHLQEYKGNNTLSRSKENKHVVITVGRTFIGYEPASLNVHPPPPQTIKGWFIFSACVFRATKILPPKSDFVVDIKSQSILKGVFLLFY